VTIRKNNDFLIKKKERYMKKTDFMTEEQVAKFLGFRGDRKDAFRKITELRQKENLPFIKITKTTRLYALPTIIDWLKGRNVILGAETENESGQNDS
jgi:hypothetical protein